MSVLLCHSYLFPTLSFKSHTGQNTANNSTYSFPAEKDGTEFHFEAIYCPWYHSYNTKPFLFVYACQHLTLTTWESHKYKYTYTVLLCRVIKQHFVLFYYPCLLLPKKRPTPCHHTAAPTVSFVHKSPVLVLMYHSYLSPTFRNKSHTGRNLGRQSRLKHYSYTLFLHTKKLGSYISSNDRQKNNNKI